MEPLNRRKKLIGSVEITKIEDGVAVRRPVYLGSYPSRDGLSQIMSFRKDALDPFVDTFTSFRNLFKLFPLWSGCSYLNQDTIIHENSLALIELNTFEVVLETEAPATPELEPA